MQSVIIDKNVLRRLKNAFQKRGQGDKPMSNKNDPYLKGKRWGFAVGSSSIASGKNGVYKADRAMQTCMRNAESGKKKLTQTERDAYRGMSHGIYDALKYAERKSQGKPKAKRK